MTSLTAKKIGEKIQKLRENHDISQDRLAKYLGITRQAIGQIEKGLRKIDGLELKRLADIFTISLDDLLQIESCPKNLKKLKTQSQSFFDPKKLENLLLYILKECGGKPNLGETVLYKILYFIDFDAFETLGKSVTGISYIKLQYGPAPRKKDYDSVIESMKGQGKLRIFSHEYYDKIQKRYVALADPDLNFFTAQEIDLINREVYRLSNMTATEITEYAHDDAPWKIATYHEPIAYETVFERDRTYSSQDYENLFRKASAKDILEELGPISEDESEYYRSLSS